MKTIEDNLQLIREQNQKLKEEVIENYKQYNTVAPRNMDIIQEYFLSIK